jgi:hypothetical protein
MLIRKITRLCAVLVFSGVSSVALSQILYFHDAIQLIDDQGLADIPSDYTSIAANAFSNTNVRVVKIPSTVTYIGDRAFKNTHLLQQVNIPEGMATIPMEAFYNSNIPSLILPSSIDTIVSLVGVLLTLKHPKTRELSIIYAEWRCV